MARRVVESTMGIQDNSQTPTRETPFRLAYGGEAVIPAEVRLMSYRMDNHDESRNDEAMRLQLSLVDEVRAVAKQRLARYQDLIDRKSVV